MTLLPASLIIVSRHRPAALMRALAGIQQMDHPNFEVIVVTDPAAAQTARGLGLPLKLIEYDRPNISAARNLGLQMAAAPVVAFLDDDAVPEPTWLSRLVAPFNDNSVTAAGGFVLGRSGLAWQWRAMWVDCDGFDHPFDAPATPSLHAGNRHRAIKTQGTNCAFRRDSLLEIGGFDEGYAFYLDEADVNLRLATMGGQTAIVPDAVVHHGFAASARRRADRTPTDLTQIGQSLALFTAKHGQNPDALGTHIAEQRARLIRHMVNGTLEPRDIRRLMAGLHRGVKSAKPQATPAPLAPSASPFSALPNTGPREGLLLIGTGAERNDLELQALDAQRSGKIVTLLLLARGIKAHRHHFTEQGWWEQSGGRFGRAFRVGERFVWQSAKERHKTEAARLSAFRPLSATAPE